MRSPNDPKHKLTMTIPWTTTMKINKLIKQQSFTDFNKKSKNIWSSFRTCWISSWAIHVPENSIILEILRFQWESSKIYTKRTKWVKGDFFKVQMNLCPLQALDVLWNPESDSKNSYNHYQANRIIPDHDEKMSLWCRLALLIGRFGYWKFRRK